jgi:anaerobic magnesium-protoporphyrin IX monomethyl ester cyclase
MAKITFISPSMNFQRSMGVYAPLMEAAPPIGVARLAAVCENLGMKAEIIDSYSERLTPERTVERLENKPSEFIGISCLTPSAGFVEAVLKHIRASHPETRIVLGNVHAMVFTRDYIESGLADAVVHGEGEVALPELLSAWMGDRAPNEETLSVSFLKDGKFFTTPQASPITDLDKLPVPSWHLTPYHLYGLLPFVTMAKPAFTVEGSRGCPYNCYFCSLAKTGKIYRQFSPGRIIDEFEILINEYGAKQIAFADAMFPLTESQGIEFCELLAKRITGKKKPLWTTETRTDVLTDKLALAMKAAGCGRILMGIESGSDDTLEKIDKSLKIEKTRAAVSACRKAGIQACGFFMLGLPGETKQNAERTVRFACELPLDIAKFNIAIPYPMSKFYDDLDSKGQLRHKRWEDYTCYASTPEQLPWVNPEWMPQELINFQNKALRRFYFRAGMICRHVFVIRSVKPWFLIVGGWILLSGIFKGLRRR